MIILLYYCIIHYILLASSRSSDAQHGRPLREARHQDRARSFVPLPAEVAKQNHLRGIRLHPQAHQQQGGFRGCTRRTRRSKSASRPSSASSSRQPSMPPSSTQSSRPRRGGGEGADPRVERGQAKRWASRPTSDPWAHKSFVEIPVLTRSSTWSRLSSTRCPRKRSRRSSISRSLPSEAGRQGERPPPPNPRI